MLYEDIVITMKWERYIFSKQEGKNIFTQLLIVQLNTQFILIMQPYNMGTTIHKATLDIGKH